MNPDIQTPPARVPFFRRYVRAIFSRKLAYALIVFVTLIALLYAEENFRGQRAWEHYRKEAEARGLQLNFATFIPPPIPDEENGANTPWIQSWFPRLQGDTNTWIKPFAEAVGKLKPTRNPATGQRHFTDLTQWMRTLNAAKAADAKKQKREAPAQVEITNRVEAARAVLDEMKVAAPALAELETASKKPRVRYPVDYSRDPFAILLPHLSRLKFVTQSLGVRASAELTLGDTNAAFHDVLTMLWVIDSARDEPFMIGHLIRVACIQATAQVIWEGIARHQWADAQLQVLQERLAQNNFVISLQSSMNAERAGAFLAIEQVRLRHNLWQLLDEQSRAANPWAEFGGWTHLAPRGWFHLEAVNYGRAMDARLGNAISVRDRTINARQFNVSEDERERDPPQEGLQLIFQHRFFTQLLLPAARNAAQRMAFGQVSADTATLACALERFRLAHGRQPATLGELAPQFIAQIPHDILTGEPFQFERVSDDDFVISSKGWPETSPPAAEKAGEAHPPRIEFKPGEWIWRSAP